MKNVDDANIKTKQTETVQKLAPIDTDSLRAENKIMEARIEEIRNENSRLLAKIDEMNISHTELIKVRFILSEKIVFNNYVILNFLHFSLVIQELQSVQNQLASENARCINLEVFYLIIY